LEIFAGEAAGTGLPPAADSAAAGGGEGGCGFGETLSRFLHLVRLYARSRGRIANRIIIKRGKGLSPAAQKTSAFSIPASKHGDLPSRLRRGRQSAVATTIPGEASEKLLVESEFLAINQNAATD
jgi:hypothetical protein